VKESSTVSKMQIVAEIVDASRLNIKEILQRATYYRNSGADIIDLGGNVKGTFPRLREVIRELKAEGFKVSVDSHLEEDILTANEAGADLILSLNSRNLELAKVLNCPAVVIPDDGESLDSLYRNMEQLERWNVPYLVDPILPPPCLGLAQGIGRYAQVRYDFPDCQLFMGFGNVTEMIDADSVGGNAFLTAIASELSIQYVLTTEVSFRAIGSVKEIALARTLMHKALSQSRIPKHIDEGLLVVKDPSVSSYSQEELRQMQSFVQDQSFRIFATGDIYCFNNEIFVQGKSAKEVFAQLDVQDKNHAFYLGQELERAETALLLNKKYVQDNPLRWGYLSDS
jgi:dihydropteroate synthase-like protein